MSQSPPSGEQPPRPFRRLWLILCSRPVIGTALILLTGLLGAGGWVYHYIYEELAPQIAKSLSDSLQRPVKIGKLEHFSLTGLRFGSSAVPPYRHQVNGKTILDKDQGRVDAVEVQFDLWKTLWSRKLNLDITLINANAYIDQTADKAWLATTWLSEEKESWLQIKLDSLRLKGGETVIAPFKASNRTLSNLNGVVFFKDDNQRFDFEGKGTLDSGGKAQLEGKWLQPTQALQLKLKAKQLRVSPLMAFLPEGLPVVVKSGEVEGDFELAYRPQRPLKMSAIAQVKQADIRLPQQKIRVKAEDVQSDLAIVYAENQPPKIDGDAQFRAADLEVPENLIFQNGRSQKQQLRRTNGTLKFLSAQQRLKFEAQGSIASGGRLRTKGETKLDLTQMTVLLLAQNVSAPILDRAFQLPIAIRSGRVDANLTLRLAANKPPHTRGTARLKDIDAQIIGLPKSFYDANGYVRLRGLTASLEGITARYDRVPLQAKGTIDVERGYNLTAQIPGLDVKTALATLQVPTLPVPVAGQVSVPEIRVTGAVNRPLIAGEVVMAPGATIDRVAFKGINAEFTLDNPTLKVVKLLALPESGGKITGTARYNLLPGAELAADVAVVDVPGDAIAQRYGTSPGIKIGSVYAQTQVRGQPEDLRTQIAFQVPQATYPTRGDLRLYKGKTYLDNIVAQVAEGTARIDGQLDPDSLQAQIKLAGITLSEFSPQLQGALSGSVALNGPLPNLSAETLRAQGQVNFSQGLSLLEQPLDARFRWTGRQILLQVTAKGFQANGTIDAQLQTPQGLQVTALNLNLKANDYDLRTLADLGPTAIPLTGRADLTGRLTGTLTSPNLVASLQLQDLAVSQLQFEPLMTGSLNFGQGVDLRVGGERDRINIALNPQFLPESFLIRRDQAIAQGRTQGELLHVDVQQFPLQAFNLAALSNQGLGPISGLASGQFVANLKRQNLEGSFAVDQPTLKQIQATRLIGNIRYRDGVASLDQASLIKDDSQYLLDAQFVPGANPRYSGNLAITKGNIADVVAIAEAIDFAKLGSASAPTYGSAADLQTVPVGVNGPLLSQLRRFTEIQQLAILKESQKPPSLFALDKLTGRFGGEIAFAGSAQTGVNADFDIRGQEFKLDRYRIEQLHVNGSLKDGLLSLKPLRVQTEESLLAFQGELGSASQTGTLRLQNIDVAPINPFLKLPVQVTGKLNGSLDLAGNLDNPQFTGQFDLVEGRLDDAVINSAQTSLRYQQAVLTIDSQARINGSQPLILKGKVPYAPAFVSVTPASDQLSLTASLRDDGFSLLSLFTDQVAWNGGKGALDVRVKGTIEKPIIDGTVRFQEAKLQTTALNQPLTNLTGTIEFNRNLVSIPRLSANIGAGQLVATGNLPMFQTANNQALAVKLQDLNLNVQQLYQGGVDGSILVGGSVLRPQVGGKLQLQNGKVRLANANAKPAAKTQNAVVPPVESQPGSENPLKFKDLVVQIGDNVKISQPPVFSFIATGDLAINGSVDKPLADGKIRFRKGSINLITALFSVDSRRENYAEFDSRFGLDPYLNIGMRTTVTEVVQATTTDLNEFAELPASAIGSIQSVKIQAAVDGRASELINDFDKVVTLTSRPNRSNGQIIALLGGGVEKSLQAGDAPQAAVNIATSAAFSGIQQTLNDALGSRATFRAFPVLLPNQNNSQSSVLAFGAELGYDITDRFSASVLQILTGVDEPTLFNLSYDINDQLRARTSVSTEGEAVGVLEYRVRF
ncbi:MAG: DUF748 domain-containing protein [Acaryochloris sp. RU_4_1]|nr:DUF748 domain-containing protein [Acaryochloris sp. RU_4_1]